MRPSTTARLLLSVLLLGLSSTPLRAADLITLGGFSRHYERGLGHNEINPGLGFERDYNEDWSWNVGVFKNSLRRASWYAVANYSLWRPHADWRAGAMVGLSTGYRHSSVIPMAMPFIEWRIDRLALQAIAIPTYKPYVDGALVLQFKWRID